MSGFNYFHNDNGLTYLIIEQVTVQAWCNDHLTIGLLKQENNGQYVVAVNLGETSWGHGHYFHPADYENALADAVEDYVEQVNYYKGTCV